MFSFISLVAQNDLNVSVNLLRNNRGHVLISLFRDCEGFPDKPHKAFRKVKADIINQSAKFQFANLPAGNYTIAVLHDENDDMKMNTNLFGIPKEGYGFSNNVMGAFGPPSCERARFGIKSGAINKLMIRIRYGW